MAQRFSEDDFAERRVAQMIATDRRHHLYESAQFIPVSYDLKPLEPHEGQNVSLAVHRKTKVVRQLSSSRKPTSLTAQGQLRSFVSELQEASASSEGVVKVFEVFEDYKNVYLLLEHCSGGTVYERILERQYFTEQESAMLVRHMLHSLAQLHENRLYHGHLTPHSFRFLNDSPHAALKLVDFGIELKIHRWEACEGREGGPELQNPRLPTFFETCKLVFCAPEFAPPYIPRRKRKGDLSYLGEYGAGRVPSMDMTGTSAKVDSEVLEGSVLSDVIDEHFDSMAQEEQELASGYQRRFEASDVWSIGSIAFLLLCGYPPFFAPSRNAILGRVHRTEFSYDPPFWSKISEEAKSFVSGCLQASYWDRLSIREALEHPWISGLADTSPSGSMFSSFMLNLRRFYRTSLIETYVANMLAARFRQEELQVFARRCREVDTGNSGFFTATDLKHVLSQMGHAEVSEAISARFLRAFRHPGESYIDYAAMLDSICLRREQLFEEEVWTHFQSAQCQREAGVIAGSLPVMEACVLLSEPAVLRLLIRALPEGTVDSGDLARCVQGLVGQHCEQLRAAEVEFFALAALLQRFIHSAETHLGQPLKPPIPKPDKGKESQNGDKQQQLTL